MRFIPLEIEGAWAIEVEGHADERGVFARTWCRDEFAAHGIEGAMVQASVSYNHRAGTVRGMHFAWPPARECKLVRCSQGRIHDVIVDLRPDSPSFGTYLSVELDQRRRSAIFIPSGLAHGFQTLADNCEVHYMMNEAYRPEFADGLRFDDPALGIRWPLPVSVISDRDRSYPDWDRQAHRERFARAGTKLEAGTECNVTVRL